MNRLLLILILTFSFQSWTKADDIRDFQIEGMSIGDSLLDYFSKETINNNIKDYYTYKKNFPFIAIDIENHESLKQYYGVQLHVKKNDNNFILYAINGYNYCKNNIKNCYNEAKIIEKDFLKMFDKLDIRKVNFKHSADKSNKSSVKATYFTFDNGDMISINIYDWSDKMGFGDNYDVSIDLKEFRNAFKK